MRSTPPWTARTASTLAAMGAAYRVGLAAALAAWPVLLGRAIFYGVCLMVLIAFWDKVGAQRLAGTLATRLPPGGLGAMTARLVMLGGAGLALLALSGRPWPPGFGLFYVAVLGSIGAGIGVL